MSLKIDIASYVSSGYDGSQMVWRLYEAGSNVLVDEHIENGIMPGFIHGTNYFFTFNQGIRDIIYTVKLYVVTGGVGFGTLENAVDVSVNSSTLDAIDDIEIIVGGTGQYDPSNNDSGVDIPILAGRKFRVIQRGIGQLRQERDIEVVPRLTGGFDLTLGNKFVQDDTFVIQVRDEVYVNPPGTTPQGGTQEWVLITADYSVIPTDFGKTLLVDSAAKVVTLTLPAMSSVVLKTPLKIKVISTNQINVVIQPNGTETIKTWKTSAKLILGASESAEIIKMANGASNYLYADVVGDDIRNVGRLELRYNINNTNIPNRLPIGDTVYNMADYPRIAEAINSGELSVVQSFTLRAQTDANGNKLNAGAFAKSDDGTQFMCPSIEDWFLRVSPTFPGLFEDANVGDHKHHIAANGGGVPLDPNNSLLKEAGLGGNSSYDLQGTANAPSVGRTGGALGQIINAPNRPRSVSQKGYIIV